MMSNEGVEHSYFLNGIYFVCNFFFFLMFNSKNDRHVKLQKFTSHCYLVQGTNQQPTRHNRVQDSKLMSKKKEQNAEKMLEIILTRAVYAQLPIKLFFSL